MKIVIDYIEGSGHGLLKWIKNCYFCLKAHRYVDWTNRIKITINTWI